MALETLSKLLCHQADLDPVAACPHMQAACLQRAATSCLRRTAPAAVPGASGTAQLA